MSRLRRALFPTSAAIIAALIAGFYVFARKVGSYEKGMPAAADAIVVLTGGEDRIAAGIEMIEARRGRRLLISGVNRRIGTAVELSRQIGGNEAAYRCCVDIGHGAQDTTGNADETRAWVKKWRFGSLIVVTSSYHMPRSLAEFAIAMPDVRLIAHPVPSRHFHIEDWWRHYPTARLLVSEYAKYLTTMVRLGYARLILAADGSPSRDSRVPSKPTAADGQRR